MRYEPGQKFTCRFKGQAKELKDFGYPVPNEAQNQYELDRLFTNQAKVEERIMKRIEYDNQDISMDTVGNIPVLRVPPRKRREKRVDSGIFQYSTMDHLYSGYETMGVNTLKRRYGDYKLKKLL